MGIMSAFNYVAIYRLKFTIEALSQSDTDTWNHLKEILDSMEQFKNYRNIIRETEAPCVPYLGVFLTDLTFIDDGNPDLYEGLVNWKKRELIGITILRIKRFLMSAYNLQPVYQIQKILTDLQPRYTEAEMYKASLKIEPRNAEKNQIK